MIADAAFASYKLAVGLLSVGLYMIGNVKGSHTGFPKLKLLSIADVRDKTAMAITTVTLPSGEQATILATGDRDKQPMTCIATAGTSNGPVVIHRRVKTIHKDGRSRVSGKTFTTLHAPAYYRKVFNAVDKHNAKRQGGACLEDIWFTHRWAVRDFQALFGVSLVNTLLSVRYFQQRKVPQWQFVRTLSYQLMNNKILRGRLRSHKRNHALMVEHEVHWLIDSGSGDGTRMQRVCVICKQIKSQWYCKCGGCPILGTANSGRGRDPSDTSIFICSPSQNPECFLAHKMGIVVP